MFFHDFLVRFFTAWAKTKLESNVSDERRLMTIPAIRTPASHGTHGGLREEET
ncbi:MAG TPA: hypothetical protein VF207_02225 [Chthoniobacterales bacterium]